MTHELKLIAQEARKNELLGIKNVLATVVALDGSSYRRPGVRMLLSSNGAMVGAVSGGCVEKEVQRSAQSVFKTGVSKMMTYDGRYRLGCEGVLYILLETFKVSDEFYTTFTSKVEARESMTLSSFYEKKDAVEGDFYSVLAFSKGATFTFSAVKRASMVVPALSVFKQTLLPCFKLVIIGGEHDAVKLCKAASLLGWQIHVVSSIKDPKTLNDFPGATAVSSNTPENFDISTLDSNSAVVLMTHNFAQDLSYLVRLQDCKLPYIGVLGSAKRRNQLENDLFDYIPELKETFINSIHSPAGLNIGAITPEEISISILSEILATIRNKNPVSLKTITGKIHTQL
ncbi:XdhC family protein [Algibacter pectinivorans]|uniref:Xanthine and CO dehydrogenase maturation factor, XdhC/CoxF family n=1 Tax=Algibacter pectinivorans TaxID=870482 RepID=A0A1I1QCS0_9FLAO|nr:XdhC/CoxI family protein [Algibacter pectinivorans]SFD17023.1 Xanthine and CO dehydrogenase maturation factor, XdhC/CoxF family [Algibacter pectinivorans]